MNDTLKKYLSTDRSTRIQTLRLQQAWQTGLAHQNLPPLVVRLLGELSAACVLLASNIKFAGSVVLQIQSNGPIRLMMVECTAALELRATAQLRDTATLPDSAGLQGLLNADGLGRFSVMLDPASRHEGGTLYQGIVPLEGETVAHALEHYMKHSEQLDTRLWLAANAQACAGVLLQRMPDEQASAGSPARPDSEGEHDTWARYQMLADTLREEELLEADPDRIVHRLFWEEDLLAFPGQRVIWHCSCTRKRVADMLRTLGQAEIDDILAEQGHVHIDCNFCGKPYDFDAVDCASLFIDAPEHLQAPGSSLLH